MANSEDLSVLMRQVSAQLATLTAQNTATREMIAEHHKTLYGNGSPGLRHDVAELRHVHTSCPARNSWMFCFSGRIAVLTVILAVVGQSTAIVALLLRL